MKSKIFMIIALLALSSCASVGARLGVIPSNDNFFQGWQADLRLIEQELKIEGSGGRFLLPATDAPFSASLDLGLLPFWDVPIWWLKQQQIKEVQNEKK